MSWLLHKPETELWDDRVYVHFYNPDRTDAETAAAKLVAEFKALILAGAKKRPEVIRLVKTHAQVGELRGQEKLLTTRINSLNAEGELAKAEVVPGLAKRLQELAAQVGALESQLDDVQSQLAALKQPLTEAEELARVALIDESVRVHREDPQNLIKKKDRAYESLLAKVTPQLTELAAYTGALIRVSRPQTLCSLDDLLALK